MLNNILHLVLNISFIDYVLFFTVVFLIILVVCLIYFIRINGKVVDTTIIDNPESLKQIAESIENTPVKPVNFTPYEKEQEEKAIISYDELLSNTGEYKINYLNEEKKDDVIVKKVDLNNIATINKVETKKEGIHLMSLEKEEEFLLALKELQKSLY